MFRRGKKENKSKLEHKLYLARETPEPVFDLSDCGLQNVPSGIYSLCKVFLKECLKLENNNLSSLTGGGNLNDLSLLNVLDIHNNEFTQLPKNIDLLTNLKVLYINKNQIKKLPSSLCNLNSLQVLDVSDNKLQSLPEEMGNMINLREINLSGNKNLRELPRTMCKLRRLNKLVLDHEQFVYPPPEVLKLDVQEILNYIHKDNNCTCDSTTSAVQEKEDHRDFHVDESNFQAKMLQLEKIKEQKRNEFIEIERSNELLQRQELELANASKVDRRKLLEDIAEQQYKLDNELVKIQTVREADKFRLIEQLQSVEQNADVAISKLLEVNREPTSQLLEQERLQEELMMTAITKSDAQLCKTDILNAMQELIEYETAKFQEFSEDKSEITRSIIEDEINSNEHLTNLLETQNIRQFELVNTLQSDNELQKIAVSALLEKSDARTWGLMQQVRLVESQLAALTSIEIDRKKLKIDKQINDLAEKRANLSALLMQLLEDQSCRRAQLLSTMRTLEQHVDSVDDYWLRQYQQLLDRIPQGITEAQNNMNPALVEALLMAGVLHCLPFLSKWSNNENALLNVTDDELIEVGVSNPEDRTKILDAFHVYQKQKYHTKHDEGVQVPSAPAFEEEEASAPPQEIVAFTSTECVICLDLPCQIIFVPCGHFCCCSNCSHPVGDCPLCRSSIDHKIRVAIS